MKAQPDHRATTADANARGNESSAAPLQEPNADDDKPSDDVA